MTNPDDILAARKHLQLGEAYLHTLDVMLENKHFDGGVFAQAALAHFKAAETIQRLSSNYNFNSATQRH